MQRCYRRLPMTELAGLLAAVWPCLLVFAAMRGLRP
jgi:hypothetical protein